MPRQQPPDHRDPKARAGLTKRRRERGLPVSCANHCGRDAVDGGAYCCDTCAMQPGHHSLGNCPKAAH